MSEWEMRMSQRELHRLHVVRLTLEGRESVGKEAKFLGISARQMKRLRRKMREGGVGRLVHGNRSKPAWNKTGSARLQKVIELARGRYQGLNGNDPGHPGGPASSRLCPSSCRAPSTARWSLASVLQKRSAFGDHPSRGSTTAKNPAAQLSRDQRPKNRRIQKPIKKTTSVFRL